MATIQLLTVDYVDESHSSAIVTVDNQKDVHIEVDKNFRIRCTDTKYSEKRVNYLRRFYYQISEKLMELSGIDSAQIQINLKKLKNEIKKGKTCEDFLKETKYANFAENFCLFISKYYINIDGRALYHDYDKEIAIYDVKDLKKCWKQFYNGDDLFGSYYRLCMFSASDYTYLIGLNRKMDKDEQYKWYDFARRNTGCGIRIGKYEEYYSLDGLDRAYKDYTEKYFGYNPQDFFIYDNNELRMRGGKVLGYCNSKNGHYTGEIKFENDINENLKKAVLNHFNSFGNTKWREVEKVEESIENKLKEENINKSSKTIQWLDYSIPEDKPYVLFEVDDYSNVVKVLGTFDTWDKAFEYRKTLNNEYRSDTDIVDVRDDDLYNEKPRSEHYGDYIDAVVRTKLGQGRIVDYNEGSCQPYKVTITHPFNGGEEGYSDWYSEDEIEFLYSSIGKMEESIENKLKEKNVNKNLEQTLAESFEKTIKSLQKEGLFENVKSFDLDFNGKGINIKLNEASEVTYMQDFSIEDYYNDITEVEAAAEELGISISFDDNEIYAKASSEEVLKQFLYDWGIIENDADFEAGLLY